MKPTRAQVLAAFGRTVPDVIAPRLRVLFCGINPGLYSGATGHHFARPGNRFWPTLHRAGFTERVLSPWEERELLEWGYGITNLVARATATAAELARAEFEAGAKRLERKVTRYRPAWVAVVGIGAYRAAFGRPKAVIGPQPETLGSARLWLLPQPSGLNANHQMPELTAAFRKLHKAVASLCVAVALLTGCNCGAGVVTIYPAGSGEPARSWRVGDTASVWAEVGYENDGGDISCPRYGSRPAPNYRGEVEPDSFAFESSRPDIATVTNQGLVTGILAGETDIIALHATSGTRSRPLRIAVQPAN